MYVLRKKNTWWKERKKKKLFFIFDKLRRPFSSSFPLLLCIRTHLLLSIFFCSSVMFFMQSRECLLEIHEKVSRILTMCYSWFHRYCFCFFFSSIFFTSYMAPSFVLVLYIYWMFTCGIFIIAIFSFSCKCPDVFDLSVVLSSELSHLLIFLNVLRHLTCCIRIGFIWILFCGSFSFVFWE